MLTKIFDLPFEQFLPLEKQRLRIARSTCGPARAGVKKNIPDSLQRRDRHASAIGAKTYAQPVCRDPQTIDSTQFPRGLEQPEFVH